MSLSPYAFQEVTCCVCGDRVLKTRAKRTPDAKGWQHRSAKMCSCAKDWREWAERRALTTSSR